MLSSISSNGSHKVTLQQQTTKILYAEFEISSKICFAHDSAHKATVTGKKPMYSLKPHQKDFGNFSTEFKQLNV